MKPLILWGGTDINPKMYSEVTSKYTQRPDYVRDYEEVRIYKEALINKQPIIGVCRGAQLLCVLNGGSLIQHSIPHKQNHSIETKDGHIFESVSADHHQIMVPDRGAKVLAVNPNPVICYYKDSNPQNNVINTSEVVWWPKTKSLGIQPHPEWEHKNSPFISWINLILKNLEINHEF